MLLIVLITFFSLNSLLKRSFILVSLSVLCLTDKKECATNKEGVLKDNIKRILDLCLESGKLLKVF